jgi:hypothetical protein
LLFAPAIAAIATVSAAIERGRLQYAFLFFGWLVWTEIAVLAVRVRQSQGAMNAPTHIPFCALRAIASSATYAFESQIESHPATFAN